MKIEFDYSMLFNQLVERVKGDRSLAWAWHCNIACCVMDEGIHHKTSNIVAARFMKLAFDVDVTTFPEWIQFEPHWRHIETFLGDDNFDEEDLTA